MLIGGVGKVIEGSAESEGIILGKGVGSAATVIGPIEGKDTTLGRPDAPSRVISAIWLGPRSRTTSMTDVMTVSITGIRSLLYICSGAGVMPGGARSCSRREGVGSGFEEP